MGGDAFGEIGTARLSCGRASAAQRRMHSGLCCRFDLVTHDMARNMPAMHGAGFCFRRVPRRFWGGAMLVRLSVQSNPDARYHIAFLRRRAMYGGPRMLRITRISGTVRWLSRMRFAALSQRGHA